MRIRCYAIALACAASVSRWAGPRPALRVHDERGAPLATVAVPGGFVLSYVHSINLSPVDEFFQIGGDGTMTLTKVLFNQLSTGMPSGAEDGFHTEGGRFATTPNRRLRELAVRVSPVPGHTLAANGSTRALTAWEPAGGLLILEAAPVYPEK